VIRDATSAPIELQAMLDFAATIWVTRAAWASVRTRGDVERELDAAFEDLSRDPGCGAPQPRKGRIFAARPSQATPFAEWLD
jgi:hypothetical protein